MLEYIPREVIESLAPQRAMKNRLRLHIGDGVYPVVALGHDYISVNLRDGLHLRGYADVYNGARHILQCLIVASQIEDDLLFCRFKRAVLVREVPPRDYAELVKALPKA